MFAKGKDHSGQHRASYHSDRGRPRPSPRRRQLRIHLSTVPQPSAPRERAQTAAKEEAQGAGDRSQTKSGGVLKNGKGAGSIFYADPTED